jgi:hypothetical protein
MLKGFLPILASIQLEDNFSTICSLIRYAFMFLQVVDCTKRVELLPVSHRVL